MSNDNAQPSRRRRGLRWFQFGLSTLLVVTLLTSVLVACQRKRISRWIESCRPMPLTEQVSGPRDPRQVVTDFLEFKRHGKHAEADTYAKPMEGQLQIMWELRPNDWRDKVVDWRITGITLPNSDGEAVRRWLLSLENETGLRSWKDWSLRSALAGKGGGVPPDDS